MLVVCGGAAGGRPQPFRLFFFLFVLLSSADSSAAESRALAMDMRAAFFEQSGAVLLNAEDVPRAQDLGPRFLAPFDAFLVASAIDVFGTVSEQDDPRKHALVEHVRRVRTLYQGEVRAVVAMSQQFSDALETMLQQLRARVCVWGLGRSLTRVRRCRQSAYRVVSRDEHAIKCAMLLDKFRLQLDHLLEKSKAVVSKLHRAFMSAYADKPDERAARVTMRHVYGDAVFPATRKVPVAGGRRKKKALDDDEADERANNTAQVDDFLAAWNDPAPPVLALNLPSSAGPQCDPMELGDDDMSSASASSSSHEASEEWAAPSAVLVSAPTPPSATWLCPPSIQRQSGVELPCWQAGGRGGGGGGGAPPSKRRVVVFSDSSDTHDECSPLAVPQPVKQPESWLQPATICPRPPPLPLAF